MIIPTKGMGITNQGSWLSPQPRTLPWSPWRALPPQRSWPRQRAGFRGLGFGTGKEGVHHKS